MNKVALIIIYNHQYNKNIETIEEIYKKRFSHIFHLVPFYCGDKPNVIPVYDNSFYFQGYVAQGLKTYYNEQFEHYFFIGDDLILNPQINEFTYKEHLSLDNDSCFITNLISFHERDIWWHRTKEAYKYSVDVPGVEAKNQLPDYSTALQKLKKFNFEIKPLRFNQIWKTPNSFFDFGKMLYRDIFYFPRRIGRMLTNKRYKLSYPLVGAYSDMFVISADTIKMFCHYCGVFAATNLFVEIGLPTAMVFTANKIVTDNDIFMKGKTLTTKVDKRIPSKIDEKTLNKYNFKLDALMNDFPNDFLYLHPIKLSKWK